MAKLILKSPYIKCRGGGHGAGGYLNYIGTRERVEIVPDDRPPTRKQEQLIQKLVGDFPDTKSLDEYADYTEAATKANASALISMTLEMNWDAVNAMDGYAKYIATRPRAERLGSHGLFSDEDHVDLAAAMNELEHYTGNIWTHIISLMRKDAARLGYDNAKAWRNLLRAHRNDVAAAMHIPPKDFRWYAAFHDEGNHPHVHMMAWSAKPGQAYLNRDGIRQIKSVLVGDVFKQEMLHLYEQKSASCDALTREARRTLMELVQTLRRSIGNYPEMETQMQELAQTLSMTEGKHKYGYLKKPVKHQVDAIVDRLEDFPVVRECYDRWLELQNQVDSYYKDERRQRLRLSEQKEFQRIKNAVIAVADQINMGTVTFEDRGMRDEPDRFADASWKYDELRDAIRDESLSLEDRDECVAQMMELAEDGDRHAQYFTGKLYRDGGLLIPDVEKAAYWFQRAARQGVVEAQYAQYTLGKLYLDGKLVEQDVELGMTYMSQAAQQGNAYAQFFLNRQDSLQPPSVMLSVTRLLYRMGQIFEDNSLPQTGAPQLGIDHKRMQELIDQKGYQAAQNYAREQQYTGPTMSAPW